MAFESLSIGKIFGIEIQLHWTFLLLMLFALFTFLTYPFIASLLILLFVCVLIHELSHSITALRNKIKVKRIILLPIGGASIIDERKMHPRTELNIALAGPLMSLLLGGIFGVLVIATPPGFFTLLFQALFELNMLMGIFNILPAFPMDGGRIFRSYLQKNHDYYEATMITVRASKYIMGIIVVGTILYVGFANGPSSSYLQFVALWNIVIVVFLYGGVKAEEETVKIRKETSGLSIGEAVRNEFLFVSPATKIEELYRTITKSGKHLVITKIGGRYAALNLFGIPRNKNVESVGDIAISIPSATPKTPVFEGLARMQNMNVGVLAVVSNGKLVGVTTTNTLQTIIALHMLSKKKRIS